nr:MAG TPA: hypothetical protein [Caudoviricetes sp.]
MKKRQRIEMPELVQEIQMLIDDWHFAKCPHDETGPIYDKCKGCPHIKLCKSLLQVALISGEMYKSNGDLRE